MRFVLVHGGSHGAWCWDHLIPEIRKLGHTAVAVDLPGHGKRSAEIATLPGYRQAVLEVLRPDDVLVGHSMGCAVATLAADDALDIQHIVYLSGPLPTEGQPMSYDMGGGEATDGSISIMTEYEGGVQNYVKVSDDGAHFHFEPDGAQHCFFHDCTPETTRWAIEQMTPQRIDVMVSEAISVPKFWAAELARSYIMCTDDHAFPVPLQEFVAKRLGVQPLKIKSSHSPYLSQPAELASLLVEATQTVPTGPLLSH